ncbi:MAG: acetyltransferase [Opitutales bacterium]
MSADKKLLIVGAGGFGREVLAWAQAHPDCGARWTISGFLDDNPSALDGYEYATSITGTIRDHKPARDELFVCAIGTPSIKRNVCESLRERGAEFIRLVHPSVILGAHVSLGEGVVLCPRVTLTAEVVVGDFVCINCHSSAGHDTHIGAWSTISGHCDLTGGARIGREVLLGSGARILPGKSVGDGALVGAGSVVLRSVKPEQKVFGNPARAFEQPQK